MVRRAQAGEIDMNNSFPSGQLEKTQQDLPGWPRIAPMMATTFIVTDTKRAPFNDARVREAISLSIDREHITGSILKSGQLPAYSFVPPSVANYAPAEITWKSLSLPERLARAKTLLEEAGYGPSKPLTFEYNYRSTGDNPRIATVLQENFGAIAPWVKAEIRQRRHQGTLRASEAKNFVISDAGWVADYNDAYNFSILLDSRAGAMNYGQYENPAYDALLDQANVELDPARAPPSYARPKRWRLPTPPSYPCSDPRHAGHRLAEHHRLRGQPRRHPPHPLHVPEEIGAPHENDKGPGAIPGLFLFSEAAAPCRR
jgi:oligopeptide transport system substrate-binding protein